MQEDLLQIRTVGLDSDLRQSILHVSQELFFVIRRVMVRICIAPIQEIVCDIVRLEQFVMAINALVDDGSQGDHLLIFLLFIADFELFPCDRSRHGKVYLPLLLLDAGNTERMAHDSRDSKFTVFAAVSP